MGRGTSSGRQNGRGGGFKRIGEVIETPEMRAYIAEMINGSAPKRTGPAGEHLEQEQPNAADGGTWCPGCLGARWRRYDVHVGHPQFGQLARCPDCRDEAALFRRSHLAVRAGLSQRQQTKRFESFNFAEGAHAAIAAAGAFAVKPDGWLVIHGAAGSGKTHLGLAVANLLIYELQPVLWFYTPDLLNAARKRMRDHTVDGLILDLSAEPTVILDEFGKARASDYAVSDFLEPLCDRRYRDGSATLFTLIGSPGDVKELISESIGRRMQDADLCTIVENRAAQWMTRSEAP